MAWTWNERSERYHDTETGRFLSFDEVNRLVDEVLDKTQAKTDRLADLLAQGQLRVPDWQARMRQLIKDAYVQQAILAAGGRAQMTPEYWGVVGGTVLEQYRYLDNFASQIAQGQLSVGQIKMRARMYINSAREAYWRIRDRKARARGYTEELWITMGDADVCSPCNHAGGLGWQPIGTFAQPGSGDVIRGESQCEGLTSCRCQKRYRREQEGEGQQ